MARYRPWNWRTCRRSHRCRRRPTGSGSTGGRWSCPTEAGNARGRAQLPELGHALGGTDASIDDPWADAAAAGLARADRKTMARVGQGPHLDRGPSPPYPADAAHAAGEFLDERRLRTET